MAGASASTTVESIHQEMETPGSSVATPEAASSGLSIIVFSEDLDKLLAAMILANGAAAMEMPVSMFFTFWGLNVLRRGSTVHVDGKKTLVEGMFGRMMPRGPTHLSLSKLNMAGLGTRMMKREMAKKHVASLGELMRSAQEQGVRFVACTMSMDLMGIHKEELIPGVRFGNVASFLDAADRGRVSLFI